MKLVRYGRAGQEKPGLIDAEGTLRDLSRVVKEITPGLKGQLKQVRHLVEVTVVGQEAQSAKSAAPKRSTTTFWRSSGRSASPRPTAP